MTENLLEFAIRMELEGKEYYEAQAALHSQNGLKAAFGILAGEENAHAEILKSKCNGCTPRLHAPDRAGLQSVFAGLADFRSDVAALPDQEEAYRLAIDKERQSVGLYRRLLEENGDTELFTFLITQEEEHSKILQELARLVNRPKTWVESAEFGLREEY